MADKKSYSAKKIIALFRKSKSEKSYVLMTEGNMYIISAALYNQCTEGKVQNVDFTSTGQKLSVTSIDPQGVETKTEFTTHNVADYKESRIFALKDFAETRKLEREIMAELQNDPVDSKELDNQLAAFMGWS